MRWLKLLMEWETIDREQNRDIMEGREPQPPKVYVAENPVMDVTPTGWSKHTTTITIGNLSFKKLK